MTKQAQTTMQKLSALCEKYQKYEEYIRFLADITKEYGLWEQYCQPLSDLFMRLKQGPIRMVVVGETSTGKSTLLNAFAGKFIAPESAGVCTPVPIWLLRHSESATFVNPYIRSAERLPEAPYAMSPVALLQMQYSAQANENFQNDRQILVYVDSHTMPEFVTVVDTPGLNANDADTEKTYGLFQVPSYSLSNEKDVPEIILFLTRHENLLQTETEALKHFISMGVNPDSCFVVHNDVRALSDLSVDTFEEVNKKAVTGLRSSMAAILPEKQSADTGGAYSFDLQDLTDDTVDLHVYSINALLARMQSVDSNKGVYPMAEYLPAGITIQERDELARQENHYQRIAEIRDQWERMGNKGYRPMQNLVKDIEEHVLYLMENSNTLEDTLRAARQISSEILAKCDPEKHKDFKPGNYEPIAQAKKWMELLNGIMKRHTDIMPKEMQAKTLLQPVVNSIITIHNKKVDMVIEALSNGRISWETIKATIGLAVIMGNPLPLLIKCFQFLSGNSLMKIFVGRVKERLNEEGEFVRLCREPDEQNVIPLMEISEETLAQINAQVGLDKEWITNALNTAIRPMADYYRKNVQTCREIERQYAELNSENMVCNIKSNDMSLNQELLVSRLFDICEEQFRFFEVPLSLIDNQEFVEMLTEHGMEILGAFNERKKLFNVVAKEILLPRLERCKLKDEEPFYPGMEKLMMEYNETLRTKVQFLLQTIGKQVDGMESLLFAERDKSRSEIEEKLQKRNMEQLRLIQ